MSVHGLQANEELGAVTAEEVAKVVALLAQKPMAAHPSEGDVIAALQHTGGHVGKAANRLTSLLSARSEIATDRHAQHTSRTAPNNIDSVAVEKVMKMIRSKSLKCSVEEATNALVESGGHVGKAVNRITGILTARSELLLSSRTNLEETSAVQQSQVSDEKINNIVDALTAKGLDCTASEARTALQDANGHVGQAINRLTGLLTARSQAAPMTARSIAGDAAFDGDDVRNVISKLSAKGLPASERAAIEALQDVGGHVGKAVNRLTGQLTARSQVSNSGRARTLNHFSDTLVCDNRCKKRRPFLNSLHPKSWPSSRAITV